MAVVAFVEFELVNSSPMSMCAFEVPRTIELDALKLPSMLPCAVYTVMFSAVASWSYASEKVSSKGLNARNLPLHRHMPIPT